MFIQILGRNEKTIYLNGAGGVKDAAIKFLEAHGYTVIVIFKGVS